METLALATTSGYIFVLLLGVLLAWRVRFKAGVWAFAILLVQHLFGIVVWPQMSDHLFAVVQESKIMSMGQFLALYTSLNALISIVAYALLAVGLYRSLSHKRGDSDAA